MSAYNIVLADDHAMFRQGIRKLIEQLEDVHISGEVSDGLELLELLKKSRPDLIILDISMPNLRGVEATREIKKLYPKMKVLILTMHKKKEFLRQALTDNAEGFLLKEEPGSELIRAVQTIKSGGEHFSSLLSSELASLAMGKGETEILTTREREVLKLLVEGKKTQEIAEALYISVHTVRRHQNNLMKKLKIKSMAELVKYAISHGYLYDNFQV
jgi:DNA-binding NarL/FixJ family response regulator